MAQFLRFTPADPQIFSHEFLLDASPESIEKLRDWAYTLKTFGLSDQSILQVVRIAELLYFRGRLDELAAQKDHMIAALTEVR